MKRFLACVALILAAGSAHGQGVGINTTGAAADTSAILDLSSTAKGFLPPRMTAAQRSAIVQPATGLLVYQTDGTAGLYYNTGTPAAPIWKQVGDAGAGGASQWTSSGSNIHYSAGNVGIQRTSPLARLDVLGGNWDVVNGEGDVRIGDASTRLKIGLATTGGGTGAATIMEQGPVGAYNVLSLGTQGNKVLHVIGATQRIGIGTDGPTAPLGFAALLGKKITLYPAGANDYGLGISSGRLQIFTDGGPGGDVAIGTDAAGAFTERLAVKNNGALAVSGNTGSAGQVLQSNGSGAAPTWVNPAASLYATTVKGPATNSYSSNGSLVNVLTHTFSSPGSARVKIDVVIPIFTMPCFACGSTTAEVSLVVDGVTVNFERQTVANGAYTSFSTCTLVDIGGGSHTLIVRAAGTAGQPDAYFGGMGMNMHAVTQVIPQ
jgi:hypothetical protein